MTVPVLGHPSFEEFTCPCLTSHLPGARQGEVKGARGNTPTRKISSVSQVAQHPKAFLLGLHHRGLQLLKPAGQFPIRGKRRVLRDRSRELGRDELLLPAAPLIASLVWTLRI